MKNSNKNILNYLINTNNHLFLTVFLILFTLYFLENNSYAGDGRIKKDLFSITLNGNLSRDNRDYLETGKNKSITINDIKASLIIIEIFNTYCTTCPKNIKELNEIFLSINKDEKLIRQVKIIAIASGNNELEINEYKKLYNIRFPIFIDYDFKIHKALGSPKVPYTIFIKKTPDKINKIIFTHQGTFKSSNEIIEKINSIMSK